MSALASANRLAARARTASLRWLLIVAILLAGAFLPAEAALLEVQTAEETLEVPRGFGLRIGAMSSDNITRVPENELDELIGVVELVSNWDYLGSRAEAVVAGNLSYRHYTENDFDSQFRGNLFMGADFQILPGNLSWRLTNHFADAPVNPLNTGSPDNTQYYNVLETGPALRLRPGARHNIEVAAARADVQVEVTDIDHERDTFLTGWSYDLSDRSAFGVNASRQEVMFDTDVDATDFDKDEAYLSYESRRPNLAFSIAGGKARTELVDGESRTSTVGWLRMNARRTSASRVIFNAARRAGDTSSMMNRGLTQPTNIWRMVAVGDPYVSDLASVRYIRGVRGRQWGVIASVQELDYMVSPFDQAQRGFQLNTDMMLARNLLLELAAGRVKIDYDNFERVDRLDELRAEFDYRMDRSWSIEFGARHVDGDSTDPAFAFKELFLTLFVNYTPGGREPLGRSL